MDAAFFEREYQFVSGTDTFKVTGMDVRAQVLINLVLSFRTVIKVMDVRDRYRSSFIHYVVT